MQLQFFIFFSELPQDDNYIFISGGDDDGGGGGSDKYINGETYYPPNEIELAEDSKSLYYYLLNEIELIEGSKVKTENDKEEINPDDDPRVVGLKTALVVSFFGLFILFGYVILDENQYV